MYFITKTKEFKLNLSKCKSAHFYSSNTTNKYLPSIYMYLRPSKQLTNKDKQEITLKMAEKFRKPHRPLPQTPL